MPALLGRKIGMTQVFREDGRVERVTVVEAGPCRVTALRNSERDGYDAVQLGFGDVPERKLTKAALGHVKKSGDAPLRHLREFRDEGEGLEVVSVDAGQNLLLVRGSVPGPRGGIVEVRSDG